MKKLLTTCSLIGALTLGALAAHAETPAASDRPMTHRAMHEGKFDPAARAAHLQKVLQLSDEQTTKVKKLFDEGVQQNKALEDKYKPQFEAFHADMEKLHEQNQAQLKAVLTPKQQQAMEALPKPRERGMCPHRSGGKDDAQEHQHDHH